jgi:membrane-bound lytic murein transglycosylase B
MTNQMKLRAGIVSVGLLLAACASDAPSPPTSAPSRSPSPTASPSPTPIGGDPFALARSFEPTSQADAISRLERDDPLVHQAVIRKLVVTPAWRDEVFERAGEAVRSEVEAGAELRALTPPRTELPPWTIVEPPPASELRAAYEAASKEFGVHWSFLASIHLCETRMGRIRGDSSAGAKGPMQFLPSTWDAYGEGDINDPHDAIRAAARYLVDHGAPSDMDRALFAYNHSDHYVRAITIYADLMRKEPSRYEDYHAWQVYYRTTKGDALLYEGWPNR